MMFRSQTALSDGFRKNVGTFYALGMILLCALSAGAIGLVLRSQVHLWWMEVLTSTIFGGITGLILYRYIRRQKPMQQQTHLATAGALECLSKAGLIAIYCWDEKGTITYANDAALKMFACQPSEIGTLRVEDIIVPIERAGSRQRGSAFGTNTLVGHHAHLVRKQGLPLSVFTDATQWIPDRQEYVAYAIDISTASDLQKTEQMFAEQMQSVKAIGRLAGGIAHILNDLLNTIVGYAVLADSKLSVVHPAHPDLERVLESSSAASELVHQLLVLSGKQRLTPEVFNANTMLNQMKPHLQELFDHKITLRMDLSLDPLWVNADVSQIKEAIINIALNAREAMPSGGLLSIRTKTVDLSEQEAQRRQIAPGPYVSIEVSDTGVGMDKETLSSIFEPFFTTKHGPPGAGMGLAMVFGILQQSLGHIEVESEPSGGSLFRILLPATLETKQQQRTNTQTVPDSATTILLVEDQQSLRELLKEVLSSAGFRVLEAQDGMHAIEIAAEYEGAIDLMLTDWVMPGMDGGAAARHVRKERPAIKVVYMSGYSEEVIRNGLPLPHEVFLEKPVRPDVLINSIRSVLKNQSTINSNGKAHVA